MKRAIFTAASLLALTACTLPSKTVATYQKATNYNQYRYQEAFEACAPGYAVQAEMERRHPELRAMSEQTKRSMLNGPYALKREEARQGIARPCLLQTYTIGEIDTYELKRREFLEVKK